MTERLSVFVRELALEAEIGVHAHEHGRTQPLVVELSVRRVEGLADTLDYETLAALARALAARGHVKLVETFAQDLAAAVRRLPGVRGVRVRVEKPQALEGAVAAGVEVRLVD